MLDLTPGGLCLTMQAPAGATVRPSTTGVLLEKGDGFRLKVWPGGGVAEAVIKQGEKMLREGKGVQLVRDEKNVVVGGTRFLDMESFHCFAKVAVGDKHYVCVAERGVGGSDFTRAQALLMAECATTLTQTQANRQAELRMQQAMARFKELDCRFKPAFNHLEIEGDEVADADLALARDIPQTTCVIIEASKLTAAGLKHLQDLPNLDRITLRGKTVDDDWLAALKPLRLRTLWLFETAISPAGWQHLKDLPTLEQLKIRDQPVPDAALQMVAGLPKLEELQLQNTGTTDAGLVHLKSMPELFSLDLSVNPLTDAGLDHLKGLKDLLTLDLTDTKVTAAGVKKLKQALPRPTCEIKFGKQ